MHSNIIIHESDRDSSNSRIAPPGSHRALDALDLTRRELRSASVVCVVHVVV